VIQKDGAKMIGKTISHYKILSKLGEGGMGVVYKAEDTKLKRTVALKFLPRGLEAHEPERTRFLQEAQAAATLNHPNICTIHDIKEEDDQQFIVMEYVDGKTLRDMAPVQKIQDALGYAIQIGEALQEAHSKGVVHRDVKTANIMVNAKNQVKVMDFGLAKLKGSVKLTKTSSTVGTLSYMAPEQITGGEVDARSDIFSFGVVLYEMLTGRLPFQGDYDAAMVYSIVNEEPEPVQRHRPDLSSELTHVLNRALEKDPGDRYQSVHDMVIDLRRAKKETSRVSRIQMPVIQEAERRIRIEEEKLREVVKRTKSRKILLWIGSSAMLILPAALILFSVFRSHTPRLNPDMSFRTLPIQFTELGAPGLSQDGAWAVFSAADVNHKWDLYFMNTTSGESRHITSDSSATINSVDISPDGSKIVYSIYNRTTDNLEIAIVSSMGGSSKIIVEQGWGPRWRPDGERIGYLLDKNMGSQSGKAEFWTIRPNGSDARCELVDSVSTEVVRFSWSPDGRSICWIRSFYDRYTDLSVYRLSTGRARQLTFDKKDIKDVCWASNGQILFSSNRSGNYNLWMVPSSGGTITQITRGTGPDYSIQISRDGSKILYRQRQSIDHIWIAGTDGSHPRQITFDDSFIFRITFSTDGKEILFPVRLKDGSVVCSIDRDGRNRKQLTSGEELVNNPFMSPDGRWIIYGRRSIDSPIDSLMVYLIDAWNPGTPKLSGKGIPLRWIDERTFLSFDNNKMCTWLNSIEGGEPRQFYKDSTWAVPLQGGRYICYTDMRFSKQESWICSAAGMKDPVIPFPKPFNPGGYYGEFDKSGKYFYWANNTGELRRTSIPSGKEEIIRGVFPGLTSSLSWFDISYDGKEIAYTDARINNKLVMIENPFK
jgi:serine/threonine protein kinase